MVRFAPEHGWVDEPLGTPLADALTVPRHRATRSRSATTPTWPPWPSTPAAPRAGCDDAIYLHGDVGVGAGIIAGGRR